MKHTTERMKVWQARMDDQPGQVARLLRALADAGQELEFMLVRRDSDGTGLVFLAPISNPGVAKSMDLEESADVHALRGTAPNRKGLGAEIMEIIADAEINLRGVSAHASERSSSTWLAFDSAKDARDAMFDLQGRLGAPKGPSKLMPGGDLGL